MPLRGKGALVIWHGITAEAEEDLIRWHNTEHIPERVGIPGFLRGRRYRHALEPRRYLDLYETESVETIRSPAYLERLDHPTPWTQRVLPHFRDTARIGCRVLASLGRGQGGAILTARLRLMPGQDAALRAWLGEAGLAAVREPAGVIAVHLLETVPEVTRIRTAEGKLKGGEIGAEEEPWPLVLLVEGTAVEVVEALTGGPLHPEQLAARGVAPDAVVGSYRLEITMDPA